MSFSKYYDKWYSDLCCSGVDPYYLSITSACGRKIGVRGYSDMINFASCDYLGLANNEDIKSAAKKGIDKYGTNISGAMSFCGYTEYHEALENKLSEWFREHHALIFTTSYLANLGAIPMLIDKDGVVLIDKFSHSSLYHGSILSGAVIRPYKHGDTNYLEKLLKRNKGKNVLVVTDGVFSVDGDTAPLDEIVYLKEKYNARLYVDDAHGVGMLGAQGRGLSELEGVLEKVDYIIGTMSKSFGSTGGFLLIKSKREKDILRTMCTTYTSSRAVSPGVAAASLKSLEINQIEGDTRRRKLNGTIKMIITELRTRDFNILKSCTAIIPIVFRDSKLCYTMWNLLASRGILTSAFAYPYVPKNTARLRLGITWNHTAEDVANLTDAISEAKAKAMSLV